MKKLTLFGAIAFLFIANGCWITDDCGPSGSGCHNGVHVWCENGDYENPLEYDCRQDGLSCAQLEDDEYACVLPCDGEDDLHYLDGECLTPEVLEAYFCQLNSHYLLINGGEKYFYQLKQVTCDHGCYGGECLVIHPDEYLPCDANYGSSCSGSVVGFCNTDHIVEAYDCDPNRTGLQTCAIDREEAICADTCDPARFEGPHYACETKDGKSYSIERSCADDGAVYYIHDEDTFCELGCNETTGKCKIHPDEAKPCAESHEACAGDVLLSCGTNNMMVATNCLDSYQNSGKTWSCAEIRQNNTTTFSCREVCPAANAGHATRICDENTAHPVSQVTSCIASNINYVENTVIPCAHGCNSQSGDCIKLVPEEGESCNYEALNYVQHCSGQIRVFCGSDNTVHASDCQDKLCYEHDEKYADCVNANGCHAYTVGATRFSCLEPNLSGEEICKLSGTEYQWEQVQDSATPFEFCEHGCDTESGKCHFIHKDEHSVCDPDLDAPYCDQTMLLQCSTNHLLYATDCHATGKVCGEVDGRAACKDE